MYLGMANPPVGSFGCTAGRRGMPGGAPGPGMPARWRHRPAPPPGLPARPRDPVLAMPDALTVARTAGPSIRAQHGPQAPGHGFPARIPGTDARHGCRSADTDAGRGYGPDAGAHGAARVPGPAVTRPLPGTAPRPLPGRRPGHGGRAQPGEHGF